MGYHKGSLRDVADRVGMSQAGLAAPLPQQGAPARGGADLARRRRARADGRPTPDRDGPAALPGLPGRRTTPAVPSSSSCTSSCRAREPRSSTRCTSTSSAATSVVFAMIRDAFEEAAERGDLRPGVDSASRPRGGHRPARRAAAAVAAAPRPGRHGRRPASLPAVAADRRHLAPRRLSRRDAGSSSRRWCGRARSGRIASVRVLVVRSGRAAVVGLAGVAPVGGPVLAVKVMEEAFQSRSIRPM